MNRHPLLTLLTLLTAGSSSSSSSSSWCCTCASRRRTPGPTVPVVQCNSTGKSTSTSTSTSPSTSTSTSTSTVVLWPTRSKISEALSDPRALTESGIGVPSSPAWTSDAVPLSQITVLLQTYSTTGTPHLPPPTLVLVENLRLLTVLHRRSLTLVLALGVL